MEFSELAASPLLYLPYTQEEKDFSTSIRNLLAKYLTCVESLPDGDLKIDGVNITGSNVKAIQRDFTSQLINAITSYLNGQPSVAYNCLKIAVEGQLKNFSQIFKIGEYSENEQFYRMRINKSNYPLKISEMFHLPFELRGLVATQRFSIPGFPCLYLGRTLYGCWEELNRPDLNEFQVSKLITVQPIRYLDLTRPTYKDSLHSRNIYHYCMTWPLIACCSVRVRDYRHTFKPEYIIPQLLLQYIRETNDIDGIKFSSTHIDFHNSKSEGDFSNLALPVKQNKSSGHCEHLTKLFKLSKPISWQLQQHAIGGVSWVTDGSLSGANSRISTLELVPGKAYPYSYSALGNLENYLEHMETFDLLNEP